MLRGHKTETGSLAARVTVIALVFRKTLAEVYGSALRGALMTDGLMSALQ